MENILDMTDLIKSIDSACQYGNNLDEEFEYDGYGNVNVHITKGEDWILMIVRNYNGDGWHDETDDGIRHSLFEQDDLIRVYAKVTPFRSPGTVAAKKVEKWFKENPVPYVSRDKVNELYMLNGNNSLIPFESLEKGTVLNDTVKIFLESLGLSRFSAIRLLKNEVRISRMVRKPKKQVEIDGSYYVESYSNSLDYIETYSNIKIKN